MEKVKYIAINCCKSCEQQLTDKELVYSNGCCPYCGHIRKGTICAYKTKTFKRTEVPTRWYQFSQYKYEEFIKGN